MSILTAYYGNFNNLFATPLTYNPRRREVWQQKMIQLQQAPNASPIRPSLTTSRQPYTRIKDIDHGDTDIRKYQIFARAIDFYPLKLEDAFYQFCKRCKVE